MNKNLIINGESLDVSLEGVLAVVEFLKTNYQFRFNVLNGKVEFLNLKSGSTEWRDLTDPAINSIILKARMEQITKGSPKELITEYVNSEEIDRFDPIRVYLDNLPEWDGQNHVAKSFSRIPGITSEQLDFLCVWIRSMVAHWRQMDLLHGNECVPVFIGAQGCGKTTFFTRLLPPMFRQYYMDHLNTNNPNDKNMALTNNPHPLTDVTGSRRFICISIPNGKFIDNDGDIDYDQLFAQIMYELTEQNAPYWFNNEQVARIQELNLNYMAKKDMMEIVSSCFRKPKEGEKAKTLGIKEILKVIRSEYPSLKDDHGTITYLGRALNTQGFERTEHSHVAHYKVIPLKAA